MSQKPPRARVGLIGGSGTWSKRIPEDIPRSDVGDVQYFRDGFSTPYGQSAPFKYFTVAGEPVLRVAFHGSNPHRPLTENIPWISAKQIASVFEQAGVEWIISEGTSGGIQHPRDGSPIGPWTIVLPDDYLMLSRAGSDLPVAMDSARQAEPFCSGLRARLSHAASEYEEFRETIDGGIYANAPWGRFETAAEIRVFAAAGAAVVGMTIGHEAPLMRTFGFHFAALNIVSNHAEGMGGDEWEMDDAFYDNCAPPIANTIIDAVAGLVSDGFASDCSCKDYGLGETKQLPVVDA